MTNRTPLAASSRSTRLLAPTLLAIGVLLGSGPGHAAHAAAPTASPTTRPSPLISGMWVWQSKYISDVAEQDQLLDFAQRQGINRLLVQVPWKKGTAQIVHPKPGDEPQAGMAVHPEIDFPGEFARLIAEAAKRKIVVEALDGAPYMGDKVHWPETLATVDALLAFNKALPADARFVGIHWDIEPYVRTDWKDNVARQQIMADYLQCLADAKRKLVGAGSPMTLSVDIPMWYDNKTEPNDNTILTYDGARKNFHEHIQDVVDYVGIMSYRQRALGPNSTSAMVENEMKYAAKIGKFVCPAFETIELKDTPQITFFGQPPAKFLAERTKLLDALQDQPGYGGLLLHHYGSLRALLEPEGGPANTMQAATRPAAEAVAR